PRHRRGLVVARRRAVLPVRPPLASDPHGAPALARSVREIAANQKVRAAVGPEIDAMMAEGTISPGEVQNTYQSKFTPPIRTGCASPTASTTTSAATVGALRPLQQLTVTLDCAPGGAIAA